MLISSTKSDQCQMYLKKTLHKAVDAEEFQSIDKQVIPFKGHLFIKQYISKNPKPLGLKVWVRAGTSRYMYRFEVHQGSASSGQLSQFTMAANMRLCDDIQRNNFFFYHFFCTIPLKQAPGSTTKAEE